MTSTISMQNDINFREGGVGSSLIINIRFETTHRKTSRNAGPLFFAAIIEMRLPLRTGEVGRLLS
jgi:hypothetical protein